MPRLARPLSTILPLVLLLALAGGCRSIVWDASPRPDILRIGTLADSPPLAFRQDRRWRGVEPRLGRALAKRLGRRPLFIPLEPAQLIPALLENKVDILMAGLPVTEALRVQIDFASPYLVVGQAALVRKADLLRFNTDIKIRSTPARVAVVADSSGDRLVARYFPHARRLVFSRRDQAVEALRRNQADLLIHDAPALWWMARSNPAELQIAPPLFAREEIAWGFRRTSVALRESANLALAEWQQDGTLEAILRQWLPVSP